MAVQTLSSCQLTALERPSTTIIVTEQVSSYHFTSKVFIFNNRPGQMYIPLNKNAYTPNTLNKGEPKQANQTAGKGFFTTPQRTYNGQLMRATSPSFDDVWSQPRLFYNSLAPAEQQFMIDAMRFENANVKSTVVRENVIIQLNRISNDIARRVARAIGVEEPEPDPTFYHNNKTANVGVFGKKLFRIEGLKVGVLASVSKESSIAEAKKLQDSLASNGVDVVVVAERMADGVDQTYSATDAINFDAVVVVDGADGLFDAKSFTSSPMKATTLYPAGRPLQILLDAFRFGKPVGSLGSGSGALRNAGIGTNRPGVYTAKSASESFADSLKDGLRTFKFLDRFALDEE